MEEDHDLDVENQQQGGNADLRDVYVELVNAYHQVVNTNLEQGNAADYLHLLQAINAYLHVVNNHHPHLLNLQGTVQVANIEFPEEFNVTLDNHVQVVNHGDFVTANGLLGVIHFRLQDLDVNPVNGGNDHHPIIIPNNDPNPWIRQIRIVNINGMFQEMRFQVDLFRTVRWLIQEIRDYTGISIQNQVLGLFNGDHQGTINNQNPEDVDEGNNNNENPEGVNGGNNNGGNNNDENQFLAGFPDPLPLHLRSLRRRELIRTGFPLRVVDMDNLYDVFTVPFDLLMPVLLLKYMIRNRTGFLAENQRLSSVFDHQNEMENHLSVFHYANCHLIMQFYVLLRVNPDDPTVVRLRGLQQDGEIGLPIPISWHAQQQ